MNLDNSPVQDLGVKIVFAIRKLDSNDRVEWREISQDKEKEIHQVGIHGYMEDCQKYI